MRTTHVTAHTRSVEKNDPSLKREEYVDGWSAAEVLKQIGGNRFIAMTGASNFARNDATKTISFKIPRSKGITHVRIRLDPNDTYTMEFIHIHGMNEPKVISKHSGIYNDQLQDVFTSETGLYTHL